MSNNLEHLTPHELLARVENRNRMFKIASVIFGVVLVGGLSMLLIIGLNTLQGVNNQLTQQKALLDSQNKILSRIKDSSDQRTQQIKDLQQHIDCVVELLRNSNRDSLKITDIQQCKITKVSAAASAPADNRPTWTPRQSGSNNTMSQNTSQPSKSKKPVQQPESWLHRIPLVGGLLKHIGL